MRIASVDLEVVQELFFEIQISPLNVRSKGVLVVWLPYGSWLHTKDKSYET